jgi:hypothetical protein
MNSNEAYRPAAGEAYARPTAPAPRDEGPSRGATIALAVIALTAVAFAIAIATGFIRFNVEGALEAPRVEVTGGAVPEVSVETGRVAVDSEKRVIEVPTVEVERAPGAR